MKLEVRENKVYRGTAISSQFLEIPEACSVSERSESDKFPIFIHIAGYKKLDDVLNITRLNLLEQ